MSFVANLIKFLLQPKPSQPISLPVFDQFPPTMGTPPNMAAEEQTLVFDPSVRQFPRAFRKNDPLLSGPEMTRWHEARRSVMLHLISLSTSCVGSQSLVLRGSLAMKALLGVQAREPGDIDWVVQPTSLRMDEPNAKSLIEKIVAAVRAEPRVGDCVLDAGAVARTDIWTYERAPGHRIAFPWRCGNLPPAMVQMDFVFEETLHSPVVNVEFAPSYGAPFTVPVASIEESLAWKILWLSTDQFPQGKDLYDAVILAENCTLNAKLLHGVLKTAEQIPKRVDADFPFQSDYHRQGMYVDWDNFLIECPWVSGTIGEWRSRLDARIKPAVDGLREIVAQVG